MTRSRTVSAEVSMISRAGSPLRSTTFPQFDYFLNSSPRDAPPTPTASSSTLRRAQTVYDPVMTTFSDTTTVNLDSPRVLSTPSASPQVRVERSTTKRSVQIGEKSYVNWARPLRPLEDISNTHIFGASLQRSRRLNHSQSQTQTPSPSTSSDDEPITPPSSSSITRSWTLSALSETEGKGLGFGAEIDWIDSDCPLADYLEASSSFSSPSSRNSPTPTQSRILSTSESMSELASPANLEQLRYLRQAALDLEEEVRRPSRSPRLVPSRPQRRIKRKAVPSIDMTEIENTRPRSFIEGHPASRVPLDRFSTPATHYPSGRTRTQSARAVYQNHHVTHSVLEISPRMASLPFTIPPRVTSSQPSSSSSAFFSISSKNHRVPSYSASIASSAEFDQPITPTSERVGFIDQVENSIMRFSNLSLMDLGSRKQKKGISRLFKKASPL